MIFVPVQFLMKPSGRAVAHRIENAGGNLICDACTCLTPLITSDEYDGIITNSIKGSYYFNKFNRIPGCTKRFENHSERASEII